MNIKTKITVAACIPLLLTAFYGIFCKDANLFINPLVTMVCIGALVFSDKKTGIFSSWTYMGTLLLILFSVYIGRGLGAYKKVPYWDKALHFYSGFVLAAISRKIYIKLKGSEENKALMNCFAFFTAVSGAALWEIYEFTSDMLIGTTAQNNSLTDTMLDIIAGTVSALLAVLF